MEYGQRIIYDSSNGNILYGQNYNCLGEVSDGVEGLRPEKIDFIDLPFESKILNNVSTYHINITKDKSTTNVEDLIVIDSKLPDPPPTYEELQQQLLQAQGVI